MSRFLSPTCLVLLFFVSVLVGDRCQLRPGGKEPHQPFQILCCGCQVKLFAHELDTPQPQAAQSHQVLQFREQCFHFPSLAQGFCKLRGLGYRIGFLSRRFADVDGDRRYFPRVHCCFCEHSRHRLGVE